ncbi:MAG: hypothetical protein JNL57_13865 [Bacteroidetes bacterium]|nr:hypothetical protein [Bacteroidota bacterium]
MKNKIKFCIALSCMVWAGAQGQTPARDAMILPLDNSGKHYIQATLLNQVWLRYNQSNPGTTVQGKAAAETLDIGLRRTRMQLFGQINDHVFVYFQFGQNNFNAQSNFGNNRKIAAFFHDAVCEYKVTQTNALKLGAGLSIINGVGRFSQPSIGTIMSLDVPVFAQATVDQTDLFNRRLSVYARGQISHLDYRFALADPFPVSTNGLTQAPLTQNATFAQISRNKQYSGYFMWQFFEHENHTTPYMTGTYLGKKKIFNLAAGMVYQNNAMWRRSGADTVYQPMMLACVESFLDMPLNKEKGTAVSAYAGYFRTNYGTNYIRFNGLMNPASGMSFSGVAKDAGTQYGNALPMFGTGSVIYTQAGVLMPKKWLGENGQLMPFASATLAKYDRLNGKYANTYDVGINWLIQGHKAKISLDYQNRPGFTVFENGSIADNGRRSCAILQYQIFF